MSKDYKAILEANKDNVELLKDLAREVNSWDGSLDYLDVQEFDDDFFNTYFDGNVMEAVRAWHFGGENNWNDEYIRFNGYGNLETLSDYRYDEEVKDSANEIIEYALDNIDNIDIEWVLENNNIEGDE